LLTQVSMIANHWKNPPYRRSGQGGSVGGRSGGMSRRGVSYALLALAGLVYGWTHRPVLVADYLTFVGSGDALASGRWHEVYANPAVQAGPLELLWCAGWHAMDVPLTWAGLQWLQSPAVVPWGGNTAGPGLALAAIVGSPVLAVAAAWACRQWRTAAGVAESLVMEIVIAALALGWGAFDDILGSAHVAEGFIPIMWVCAGLAAVRGQVVVAGVLIGLSAGWETWGVLGAAVVLVAPVRSWWRAAVVGGACLAVLFLPFVIVGPFRMLEFRWQIEPGTLAHALTRADEFSWMLRVGQAGLALAASCLVLVAVRRSAHVVWLAPLAACSARLLLDPVGWDYYWNPLLVLALTGAAAMNLPALGACRARPTLILPTLAVAALCWLQAVPNGQNWRALLAGTIPLIVVVVLQVSWQTQPFGRQRIT
jgi:hypothetical protein